MITYNEDMDEIKSTREFFNELADDWDETTHHNSGKLYKIITILGLKSGERVLDVGCGTGVMIPHIREHLKGEGSIVAVDFSEKMIDIAREKFPPTEYPDVEFLATDVNEMKMKDEYDAILCYSCFPHFNDQFETTEHLSGGLKENGRLMVAHSESRNSINEMHRNAEVVVSSDYLPTSTEIVDIMKRCGLDIQQIIDSKDIFLVMGMKKR